MGQLSHLPPTGENMESQIQELLEGQEAIRYELNQVRLQANNNYNELENLRHHAKQAPSPMPYPQPASPMPPTEQHLQSKCMAPLSPQPAMKSMSPVKAPDSGNNVLRNLGYHVNHDHFTNLHE